MPQPPQGYSPYGSAMPPQTQPPTQLGMQPYHQAPHAMQPGQIATPHGMQSPGQFATPQPMQPYPQQPFMTPGGMTSPLVQHPFGAPQPGTRSFDMGRMAAREATIRKLVWIIVLVVGTIVGIILAMRL
jgi:hypothetical protein